MAWIYSLSAECGQDKSEAEAVAAHFTGFEAVLDDGSRFPCSAGVTQIDCAWWCMCCPEGVSRTGISSVEDQRIMTEIGFALYERLRTSPPFRFALVGVEVDGFRNYDELEDDVGEFDFNGLVLSESIWQRLGKLEAFPPFRPGYRWRPFVRAR